MAGTIICYGDSNTFGYDSRMGTEGRFPKEIRWTGILDDRTEYKVKNHGICGRCIPEMTGLYLQTDQILGKKSCTDMVVSYARDE